MLVGELDEDVFEAGGKRTNFGDGNSVFHELVAEVVESETVFDKRMDRLAENGGAANAREVTREAERARNFRRGDFDAQGARRLNVGKFPKRLGCAVGDELAVINVRDLAAVLGFVHVMVSDKKRDAMTGKLEKKIPELAARDGIDARSGLVEEKKRRLVQNGAPESEAVLPR